LNEYSDCDMISFLKILRRLLTERMSFHDLIRGSESGRKQRARTDVRVRPIRVTTINGNEAWTFSYKSYPSTTGIRWKGYINFFKKDVSSKDNAEDLDCMVDCQCPDYRYRWAYPNSGAGVGTTGPESWNKNNGQPPRPRSQGGLGVYPPGACKHLIALGKYLETQISSNAPDPENEVPPSGPQTVDAPYPYNDTYTDDRSGSDTLQERNQDVREIYRNFKDKMSSTNKLSLYERIDNFVKSHPEFDVEYYEDED